MVDSDDPYSFLTEREQADLKRLTDFAPAELNELYKRFQPHILRDERATTEAFKPEMRISDIDSLSTEPAISVHPLIRRVLLNFNQDKSGKVKFSEFAQAMRALSVRATLEDKLKFTFELFDVNGNGTIEPTEMFELFRLMLGRAHDDRDLQAITEAYLRRFPAGFTFDLFCKMFDVSDLNKLTLNL